MTTNERKVLKNAESLVREVLQKDFHQKVSAAKVREVALKVAKAIPSDSNRRRAR